MASPLYDAILSNDLSAAESIIAEDKSIVNKYVNKSGKSFLTNFQAAVLMGSPEMIQLLIENGAEIEKPLKPIFEGNKHTATPLKLAVSDRDPQIVKMLLDAGANPNTIVDALNSTPIHFYDFKGDRTLSEKLEILDLLIKAGANVNTGMSPLLHTSSEPEIIKRLIAAGANVNARNLMGETPLSKLLKLGRNEENSEENTDENTDENTEDNNEGNNEENTEEIISLLLENGADVKLHVGGKSIYLKAMASRRIPDHIKALLEEYKDHSTWLRRRQAFAAFGAAGAGKSTATRRGGRRKRYRRRSLKSQRR